MAEKAALVHRRPDRPRGFDVGETLDEALTVFRKRGCHAASLDELGAAMRPTPGSICKALGGNVAVANLLTVSTCSKLAFAAAAPSPHAIASMIRTISASASTERLGLDEPEPFSSRRAALRDLGEPDV